MNIFAPPNCGKAGCFPLLSYLFAIKQDIPASSSPLTLEGCVRCPAFSWEPMPNSPSCSLEESLTWHKIKVGGGTNFSLSMVGGLLGHQQLSHYLLASSSPNEFLHCFLQCQEASDGLSLEEQFFFLPPCKFCRNVLGKYFLSFGAWPTLRDGKIPI